MDVDLEILSRIEDTLSEIYIDCPDCENMGSDPDYTCTTCWQVGGNGKINVLSYLKEMKNK